MDPLTQALADTLPHQFLRALVSGGSQVYAEAWARTYSDPLLGDTPESHDLIGQERHALYQRHLARTCASVGLECPAVPNPRATSFHREATVERFRLSASAVRGPAERPRNAQHRRQNSEINEFLPQGSFNFGDEAEIRQALDEPKSIYGIILHGPDRKNPKEIGFHMIAIPSDDGRTWLLTVALEDLIQLQINAVADRSAEQIEDKAVPRRRRKEREG